MQAVDFIAAVEAARPGAKIIYYTGHFFGGDRRIGPDHKEVDILARAAWGALEAGRVRLVQRRIKDGVYEYLAVKRHKPFNKVKWTGCYEKGYARPSTVISGNNITSSRYP